MDEDLWISAVSATIGWLDPATPAGLFVTSHGGPSIWITGTGYAVRLGAGPDRLLAWQLSEDDDSYPGLHLGPLELVVDPLAITPGEGAVYTGDLLFKGTHLQLVSAPGEKDLVAGPRVDVGALQGPDNFPHRFRCHRWALMARDLEGDLHLVFDQQGRKG